jgi:hypothetical protein
VYVGVNITLLLGTTPGGEGEASSAAAEELLRSFGRVAGSYVTVSASAPGAAATGPEAVVPGPGPGPGSPSGDNSDSAAVGLILPGLAQVAGEGLA